MVSIVPRLVEFALAQIFMHDSTTVVHFVKNSKLESSIISQQCTVSSSDGWGDGPTGHYYHSLLNLNGKNIYVYLWYRHSALSVWQESFTGL